MNDGQPIEVRLKETAAVIPHELWTWLNPLLLEAAAEIDRLTHEIKQMKERDRIQKESDDLAGYGRRND